MKACESRLVKILNGLLLMMALRTIQRNYAIDLILICFPFTILKLKPWQTCCYKLWGTKALGEWFFIVDSDDQLPEHSIENIIKESKKLVTTKILLYSVA